MNQTPPSKPVSKRTIQGMPITGSNPSIEVPPSEPMSAPVSSTSSIPGVAIPQHDPNATTNPRLDFSSTPGEESPSVAPPPPKVDPYIGVTIDGRYKVESVLGEGGMGVVYAGRHKVIDKRVAIKVLRGDLSRDKEMTDRFLTEARAASSIGHPNIVDVSDFGTLPDGSAYFVMEFLEGKSLAAVTGEQTPMPTKRLLHIGRQVADALEAAHQKGIIHRDLKPDNIFLGARGSEKDFVKILDFGIAKVATSGTKLTRAGTVFGTPHYMSPEQAAGAPVDHRTDIYALGVMLYEMAAGKVPFDADNYMGILTQHMYKAPVPIRALMPPVGEDVPPGLEAIILKALSKKPEQRYSSMADIAEDLERLEKGEMPKAVTEMIARSGAFNVPADYFNSAKSGMSDVVPATPASGRPKWPLFAGIAGVVAAVAIVAAIFSTGSRSSAQTAPSAAAAPPRTEAPAVVPVVEPVVKPAGKPVVVLAVPLDAEVFRDGENLGKVPVTVAVPDGQMVSVEVRHEGYASMPLTLDGSRPREEAKLVKAIKSGPLPGKGVAPGGPVPKKRGGGGDIVDPWGH
jgi:eukaryotic-like serine/threonine-protein kinase